MSYLRDHWTGMVLLFVAAVVLAFTFQFRQCRIERDGESASPGWYRIIQYGGMLATIILVFANISTLVGYLSNFLKLTGDAVAGTLAYAIVIAVAFVYAAKFGAYLASLGQRTEVDKKFDNDKVVQYLVKDAEAGAKEILIFRDRLEGRRSYTFDVDGYNHAAFSEYGCKELAGYVMRHTENKYTKTICRGLAGPSGPHINSNSAGEGAQYKFSHVLLKKVD
ncbi:MAG: hypothetical protein IKZ69_07395 [Lachnospiraceae bacterium]|nr:hypothetical protein [Lachnospiraceae bacterium]